MTDEQAYWIASVMVRFNGIAFGWRGTRGVQVWIMPGTEWRKPTWVH